MTPNLQYENILEEIHQELKRKADEKLSKITSELREIGFEVEERLIDGIPFKEILRVTDQEKVDAIVIGSTGKGLLSEMLLGSTSEKVLREAKVPVLVVK